LYYAETILCVARGAAYAEG